jgi:hypothetical protein
MANDGGEREGRYEDRHDRLEHGTLRKLSRLLVDGGARRVHAPAATAVPAAPHGLAKSLILAEFPA